ncbi:uncharacterized protein LOC117402716 isoform X2 [Acipenser ruthenus]|uniref:uncharacterized protein LOC117402716 isoform X2 n=1 Tax=Acipenser ruthenus TaxID=7906 RepID=UPI002741BA03|nr:uncharacterized protein LOC117402716 isoform X2 [Acipenser ruthenus]
MMEESSLTPWCCSMRLCPSCLDKIELLRANEPRQGFTGAVVKAKVKSVIGDEELPPPCLNKSTLPTAEELKKLTRKIFRGYSFPSLNDRSMQELGYKWCTFRSSNSKLQAKENSLASPVRNRGGYDTETKVFETALSKQTVFRTEPVDLQQESQKILYGLQCDEYKKLTQRFHHGLSIKNLQTHQEPKKLCQPGGSETSCMLRSTNNQFLLPSLYTSTVPSFLPRTLLPMEKALARRQGNKKPTSVSTVTASLISRSLELKQRSTEHYSNRQSSEDTPTNDNPTKKPITSRRYKDIPKSKAECIGQEYTTFLSGLPAAKESEEPIQQKQKEEQNQQCDALNQVHNPSVSSEEVVSLVHTGDKTEEAEQNVQLDSTAWQGKLRQPLT